MEVEGAPKRSPFTIRRFCVDDADSVQLISRESPQASNWSKESYLNFAQDAGSLALVSFTGGTVNGFFIGRLVGDQAEVLNLAVSSPHRRKGAASALLSAALREFQSKGAKIVYLEVRESNTAAIAFYHKHRFVKTGLRKGYYRLPDESALTMLRELTG